jgi:hypothetical protein
MIRLLTVAIRHPLDIRRLDGATRSPTRLTAVNTTLAMIMSGPGPDAGADADDRFGYW